MGPIIINITVGVKKGGACGISGRELMPVKAYRIYQYGMFITLCCISTSREIRYTLYTLSVVLQIVKLGVI